MEEYISKSALVAEIESRISDIKISQKAGLIKKYNAETKIIIFKSILSLIDTLEVKWVGVDLDKFVKEEFNKYSCVDDYGQLSVSYNMAEFYGMIKRLTKAQKGE